MATQLGYLDGVLEVFKPSTKKCGQSSEVAVRKRPILTSMRSYSFRSSESCCSLFYFFSADHRFSMLGVVQFRKSDQRAVIRALSNYGCLRHGWAGCSTVGRDVIQIGRLGIVGELGHERPIQYPAIHKPDILSRS